MGTNHRYSEKGLYRDQINSKINSKHAVVELPNVVDSTTITYSGKYNDYVCRCFWSVLKPTISTGALLYFTYILLPVDLLRERSVWYMSFFALNALHQILVAAAYLWTEYGCCCWFYDEDDDDDDDDDDDFPNNTTNPTPPLRTVVGFTILLGTAGSNALVYLFLGVTCLYNDENFDIQYDEYRKVRLGIVRFSSMALLSTVYHAVIVSRSSALCRRRRSNN